MPRHNKSGFILPLALSIIGLAIALVTYVVNNGRAFRPAARMMIEREQARMLARSGIEIAMSQLSIPDKKESANQAQDTLPKDGGTQSADTKGKEEETLFSSVLPRMNVWQMFPLKRTVEGIQGEIGICLMSEEGKLDLNTLYDPAKGQLVEESISKIIDILFQGIEKSINRADLRKSFEKFLQDRKTKLDDVTELLTIEEFNGFKNNIFYNPPDQSSKGQKRQIYLTDIFTTWSGKKTLQPWLLSESVRTILDLSGAQDIPMEEKKKVIAEVDKTLPGSLSWPDGWDKYLKSWYKKEFKSLPKGLESLLDTKFDPAIFSVLCYGKVGKTMQKVFAILERVKASSEKNKPQVSIRLKKLYWI